MAQSKPVLMAVLAHPDDESFGMGGTLALYAARGVEVHLICATRGEVGAVAPEYLEGYRSIADRRESELRCAAGILGLNGVHFLDYRDSGMPGSQDNSHPQALAAQPLDEVASKVVRYMRELRPQVVLTFDPIGGYLHPDHVAIQRATVRAFEQAGNPSFAPDCPTTVAPQRMYFHTFPHGFLKLLVKLLPLFGKNPHRWGSNGDVDLVPIAQVSFPTNARLDIHSVLDQKRRAGACHASQGGGRMGGSLTSFFLSLVGRSESFMRAAPPPHPGDKIERDLFQAVR